MLKIYDKNMNYLKPLAQYKDLKVTEELSTGYKVAQFSVPYTEGMIQEEQKIDAGNYLYVVKEINTEADDMYDVYCKPYFGTLQSKHIDSLSGYALNLQYCMEQVCKETDWSFKFMQPINGVYTVNIQRQSALDALSALRALYNVEFTFDTKSKEIQVWNQRGAFKQTAVLVGDCKTQSNTYDLVTRLIPVGKNGTTINMVNNGSIWVEDYSYTDEIIVGYWFVNDVQNADDLLKLARDKIQLLCKPQTTYKIETTLPFEAGDMIKIIDPKRNINVTERITKTVNYPNREEKNYIELGSPQVSFDDIYKSFESAQKIINEDTLRNLTELNHNYN